MKKVRVGIIGCGSITKHRHFPEYTANPHVEIAAFCDLNEARAKSFADQSEANVYTSYKELLSDPSIDAVSVNLPNALHAPVTIDALKAGKHVLCEKPMATSIEEADEMIETAKANGKNLMIGHNQRFVASHEKARTYIQEGKLGNVYSFRTAFGHGGPEGWSVDGRNSWFFEKEKAFIGALGDLGVHKSDLIRYVFDQDVIEVGGFVDTIAKEDTNVDDNAVCIVKLKDGTMGTLTASWSHKKFEDNATIIYGEKGVLRLEDDEEFSFIFYPIDGPPEKEDLGKIQTNDEGGQSSTGVIDEFISSLVEERTPLIPGEEGKKALQIVLAAMESSKTKKIVSI
ncbi:Gfo/Idh/MocA family protein [Jeotgalibacillus proteolyticus]|uniref:Gfo/Idh/MocA family oxidoreductase n=1 Tax=Jeotgalibacillus proteolyticus TaxID=2082395 RepID=A0A2S5GAA2_9BACL|nr:Gfo/Idh/MocA family oxidoreductase [Jeotgalibacillus proteolyticus]PPA69844.1 gfo/Idh/MocA family oxidoreductase [Jeotgalibacillus proteolyticus]